MFLNQLSTDLKKALFLELAITIMMAASEDGILAESEDGILNKFLASINENERKALSDYKYECFHSSSKGREFFSKTLEVDDYCVTFFESDLSNHIFESDLYNHIFESDLYNHIFGPNLSNHSGKIVYSADSMNNTPIYYTKEGYFPAFWYVLKASIRFTLSTYANDASVTQEALQSIINSGENILNLTPEKIQSYMAVLPKVKQDILQNTVNRIIQEKEDMKLALSERDKKIILCELIGAGYSSGAFEEAEQQLLNHICKKLEIDSAYIEDFSEPLEKLVNINKELSDLINE